jgi:hypothetical protein|nr:hypothetical protein [Neorhizobium tomejilense]
MAAKKEKKPKAEKPKKAGRSEAPVTVAIGWLETDSPKDARAYARGYVQQRFMAHEESWYSILRFHGGFLWEAHQGGDGKGYIKSAAKALENDPGGEHWFRSGDRAYRIIMQDGKPFPHQMPADKSVVLLNSGTAQLDRNHSMVPYTKKGTGWLASGIVLASSATLFFAGSLVFYGLAYNPGPSVRATDLASLPHMKWHMVSNVGVEEIVQKLQLQNREQWSVDKRAHQVEGLDKLRKQRADLERANREREIMEDMAKQEAFKAAEAADEAQLKKTLDDAVKPAETEGAGQPAVGQNGGIPVGVPVQTTPGAQSRQPQQNTGATR